MKQINRASLAKYPDYTPEIGQPLRNYFIMRLRDGIRELNWPRTHAVARLEDSLKSWQAGVKARKRD